MKTNHWHHVSHSWNADSCLDFSSDPALSDFETPIDVICICFQEPSLYTVKAVFILDNDGNRLLSKVECHSINFISRCH